jgi:hypothetical protein
MLFRSWSAVVVVTLSSCAAMPPPPPPLEEAPEEPRSFDDDTATRFLIDAEVFEEVAISYDAHESDGARAWRVVFDADDAAAHFRRIAQEGALAGKVLRPSVCVNTTAPPTTLSSQSSRMTRHVSRHGSAV